ncbi:MAG TPA: dihydrolipoamide acetyltransferase family protein [Levilinea sp.]|nr:dihydrolipoamide acetyltransferase family protein [Levilinea sp.]
MATEFFIPKLGQTVEQVTIVSWLVEDGQKIAFGDQVMEVETDKAVFPVEANGKGYIHLGPYKVGDIVPVLTVVAIIGAKEDKFEAGAAAATEKAEAGKPMIEQVSQSAAPAAAAGNMAAEELFASPRARKLAREKGVDLSQVVATGEGGRRVAERDVIAYLKHTPKITPLAQRMASIAGVDLQGIIGTGPGGKIIKEDIERGVMERDTTPRPAFLPDTEILERVPLSGVRSIIANRMSMSVHTTARVTLVTEVDATEFVAARIRLKEQVEAEWGFTPGYNDLLARICAFALRRFPYMNARLAKDAIEVMAHVNIGIAVDTERGLLVPVIKDADHKNLREFGLSFREMVERARMGRSLPDDLSGGTFTITNLGMYDVDAFTPVINLPEAAILGVGRIARKPVEFKDTIALRHMLTLSLVFDHRLVDGAPAARFLQYIKRVVEEPYLMLAE